MWKKAPKDADGEMERLACWKYIHANGELAEYVGDCGGSAASVSNAAQGKAMLEAMQEKKALDQISSDGRISQAEFQRLYDETVLANAQVDSMQAWW